MLVEMCLQPPLLKLCGLVSCVESPVLRGAFATIVVSGGQELVIIVFKHGHKNPMTIWHHHAEDRSHPPLVTPLLKFYLLQILQLKMLTNFT
jgi:hypothetical protein